VCFGTAVGVLSVAVVNVLTRRELLRLGLASAVALPLAGCTVGRKVTTVGRVAFTQPLRIPPLAQSRVDASGHPVFELTARTSLGGHGHDH